MKVILVGPLPPPFSGTTVSFEQMQTDMTQGGIFDVVEVFNTQADKKASSLKKLTSTLKLLWQVKKKSAQADYVIVNASNFRAAFLGALLSFLKTPVVLRVFGGSFFHFYKKSPSPVRRLVKITLNRCIVLLQTKEMIQSFKDDGVKSKLFHFPTSRNSKKYKARDHSSSGESVHFIMLSEVREEKGVFTLAKALKSLAQENLEKKYHVSIYGEGLGEFQNLQPGEKILGLDNFTYGGVLSSEEVPSALSESDCFILPTHYQGEGYPGSIIEAFHCGLPVISTRWNNIPELVTDESGLLISPKDSDALKEAMKSLINDTDLKERLAKGSLLRSKDFDSNYWNGEGLYKILKNG